LHSYGARVGDVAASYKHAALRSTYGNYSFTVDVSDGDLFNPKQADKYAITVLSSNGLVWRQIGSRTNPPAIGGGNITVKAK